MKRVFVLELRANGHDVVWVDSGYEEGTTDAAHLERSENEDRVILSNDSDFLRIHDEYDHAGIVFYGDQSVPVTEFIRGIKRIERLVPEEELRGNVLWLDEWM